MKPSAEVSMMLAGMLQRELGTGYDVLVQPVIDSIQGVPIAGRPSFVVYDRERNSTTIVEVSGSWLADDLPIAAAAEVLSVGKKNRDLHPRMVLVSTSRVHQMIREVLSSKGVELIVTDQPAEAVSRVTSLIRAAA
jgi:hypothetical protein